MSVHGIQTILGLGVILRHQYADHAFVEDTIPVDPGMDLLEQLSGIFARATEQFPLPTGVVRDVRSNIVNSPLV